MRSRLMTAVAAVAAGLALTVSGAPTAAAGPGHAHSGTASPSGAGVRRVCGTAQARGRFECLALLRVAANGAPLSSSPAAPSSPPIGYGPAQIQDAYKVAAAAASRGGGQTVALVDAYDDPNAEADLAHYRAEFGLPPCTSANGCFRKVNEEGAAAPLPAPNAEWAVEEALDIEMVSAVCPRCHILLAEATDNQAANLAGTVATAAKLGATEISNSYGGPEFAGETAFEPFFDQPGVAVTAAAGDSGFGTLYPAASAHVTAVGGTSLFEEGGTRGWAETVWDGSGSGCSTQIPKPAWQHDGCTHRMDNDVAAVADPYTGVSVYDTFAQPGWLRVGGTSVGSPIVASVYALIGNAGQSPGGSYFYAHPKNTFDVTSGSDGTCSPAYLCSAGTGYDGPTGLGTPDFTGVSGAVPSCEGGWSAVPTPNRSAVFTGLSPISLFTGVAAVSPSNVWSAGTYFETNQSGPGANDGWLADIEHWNGSGWQQSPAPNPVVVSEAETGELLSVSFDRPNDGWAVGLFETGGSISAFGQVLPLLEHWDGKRWSLSPVLTPISTVSFAGNSLPDYAVLNAVSALSPSDVWVSGYLPQVLSTGLNVQVPFVEHFNGTAWRLVDVPGRSESPPITITGLHAFSATDVWASGWHYTSDNGDGSAPAMMHWDGHVWSVSNVAQSGSQAEFLEGVAGASPDDVWAVGGTYSASAGSYVPFTEHWDGDTWSIVPTVNGESIASHFTRLNSVVALSGSDAWAVGGFAAAPLRGVANLIEHWNGSAWTRVTPPTSPTPQGLGAVSASSAANVWAVGNQVEWAVGSGFGNLTYALRYGCRDG